MNRSCRYVQKEVIAYLDGELSAAAAFRVQEHLNTCAACRHEAEQLWAARGALRSWEAPAPSEDYEQVFEHKLAALKKTMATHKHRTAWPEVMQRFLRPRLALATGAVLAVCMVVFSFLTQRPQHSPSLDEFTAAGNMELFRDMDIIQNSEALEHFEMIQVLDALDQEVSG